MSKIAFFSESPQEGKTPRNFTNMRTEYAWYNVLDSTHHSILNMVNIPDNSYDIGVIIIPKELEHYANFDAAGHLKRICKKTAFMQEGPSWYFQSLDIWKQMWFFNVMDSTDFVLCHNDIDKEYYEGLFDKPVYINPTLMIEDVLDRELPEKEDKVIIGGNFVRWYGGFNSYMTALHYNVPIWAPSMGRKKSEENNVDGLNHLPYLDWKEWIYKLAEFKYAVHLNPNTIGGTFSLNCGYLGIPCIGNIHQQTQRLCFPDLSVESHDLKKAKKLVNNLKNEDFYEEMSQKAKENYRNHFGEDIYIKHMEKVIKEVLHG
tara:strand:- start:456 stop:1406 length:951 start_codon:yes stop_codon:yes gene_type:complete